MGPQNKAQFNSLDQFNSLMTQASQAMSCDSECQRKKTAEDLKKKIFKRSKYLGNCRRTGDYF